MPDLRGRHLLSWAHLRRGQEDQLERWLPRALLHHQVQRVSLSLWARQYETPARAGVSQLSCYLSGAGSPSSGRLDVIAASLVHRLRNSELPSASRICLRQRPNGATGTAMTGAGWYTGATP